MPVTIKQVAEFFKIGDGTTSSTTGDPRNSLSAFSREWKELTDEEKDEFKALIGEAIGA